MLGTASQHRVSLFFDFARETSGKVGELGRLVALPQRWSCGLHIDLRLEWAL